ncbi:hypothetical protein [Sedimentitalea nanhaiensis]|uniref:TolB amino-terminal domain-containing protein n=1 Tax=Sedimentitalea nanhaiensis TaxID=999627 RepID=A0A1I7DA05_9RHOB|nr:hypothetical protein [Sedimentitalea nanhaiensis]SFU08553.1 TolB amino-terminal domain-containing protein [Sedimentitalea nanhaiensis]
MTNDSENEQQICDPTHLARIEKTMAAIKASGKLGRGKRRTHLLDYLVGQECAGKGAEIKAFAIALDVFGRDDSFDPASDSIVRSEVGRLRDALNLFFAGNTDPELVLIDIPKGTYRPRITRPARPCKPTRRPRWVWAAATAGVTAALVAVWTLASPRAWLSQNAEERMPYDVLRIAVLPFEKAGDHASLEEIAFGLYSELSMDLSAYPWIAVVSPLNPEELGADYVLKSSILWQGSQLLSNAQLVALPDQNLVWSWSDSVAITVSDIQSAQNRITSGIAQSIGSENGISPDLIIARNARHSETSLEAFICFISIYKYIDAPTNTEHLKLRECLERVVSQYPKYGEAWAGLGILYMDEVRFGRNPRPGRDSWADARAAIDKGLQLAPLRNPTLTAAIVLDVQGPSQNLSEAAKHGRKLLELFPRHPMALALIGSMRAEFVGQWNQGLAQIDQAIALEQTPPSAFFVTRAFHAAMGSDDAAAVAATLPLTTPTSKPELLLRYLAASRVGQLNEMQRLRTLLARQGLPTQDSLVEFVKNRRYHRDLEQALLSQLQRAFQRESKG